MTGREIAAAANALMSVASKLQELGNNYYAATAAWTEFPGQVETLRDWDSRLATQLERYGQDVGRALQEAQKLLQKEVKKLETRKRKETDCLGKVLSCASLATRTTWEIAFPKKIGLAMEGAIRAYGGIEEQLRKGKETEEAIRYFASTTPISPPFCEEISNRYVPLERTESNISSAITAEEVGSPNVILFYGGPGTGKSTVSRQISLKYKSKSKQVVWLECGPTLDPVDGKLKLLRDLGWSCDLSEIPGNSSGVDHFKATVQSRLQNLLRKQKLLIVLDDLQRPQFLQDLLNSSGPNVKYLVTSQKGDICDNLTCNFQPFKIDNLLKEDGKKIAKRMLAVHIGYTNGDIPGHLQEVADKTIDQAQGIPLVLATLGSQLRKADHNDAAVWKYVLDNSSQFLMEENPLTYVHGIPYLKSYWSALKQSIDSIGTEAKQLLFLLGMCKDASVPEAVVFFLFSSLFSEEKSNLFQFTAMTTELESRQLLDHKRPSHLQIHSLTKGFLVDQREEPAMRTAESSLKELSYIQQAANSSACITRATMKCVLVCLYLDVRFVPPIAAHIDYATFSDTKKTAVEPITLQLLARDVSWTEEFHQAARQVFLEFLCHNSLCNDHLSRLLQSSSWVTPALKFLQSTSVLEESFWAKNTIHNILGIFEKLVGDSQHPHIQTQAAKTLTELVSAHHEANCENVLSETGLLHQLVNLMSHGQNADVQCSGARFFDFCFYRNRFAGKNLLSFPSLLSALVNSLADDRNAHLQRQAANVLSNMSLSTYSNPSILNEILSFPYLLRNLSDSLKKQFNPQLQVTTASAIAILAGVGANQAMRKQITSHPGLLDNLEIGLDEDNNPHFRVTAATALIKLSWTRDSSKVMQILAESLEMQDPDLQENTASCLADLAQLSDTMRNKIVNFPRMLETLIKCLDNDLNSGLQTQAARALLNLASSSDPSILTRILNTPYLLQNLAASLRKRMNPELQESAAWAIANLAGSGANQAMREQIASHPGLLDNLEIGLDEDDNPHFRVRAATALIKLSWTKDSSKVMQILVASLEMQDPDLQENAASCLAGSAQVSNTIRNKILNFPRMLETLIKCLDNDLNSGLQTQAARELLNLASSSDPSILTRILNTPYLLQNLAASLRKRMNPELQKFAAWAIANLAGSGANQAMREQIASHPGLLDNLEIGLDEDDNPHFRVRAATALIELSWTKDSSKVMQILAESLEMQDPDLQEKAAWCLADSAQVSNTIRNKILNFPRMLETLIKCLDNDLNSGLQTQAARALTELAYSSDPSILTRILNSPYLLQNLAASLRKRMNPELQESAAWAIANLAGSGANQAMREQIASHPGLLDNLEIGLDEDDNPHFRVRAATALIQLSWTKDSSKVMQILVASLEMQDPDLQENAASCLAGSAQVSNTIRNKILNFPRMLETLIKCLDNDLNSGLQTQAARALLNLASSSDPSILTRILNTPYLLQNLAASLRKRMNPELQKLAARAIANLAGSCANQAMREQIASHPGLLDNLEICLDYDDNPHLRVKAATALIELSWTKDTSQLLRILAESFDTPDPDLQEKTASCLADLAQMNNTIINIIVNFPRMLETLIKSLDNDVHSGLQTEAARALLDLARSSDPSILTRILNSPSLLQSLAASLTKRLNPQLQEYGTWAIGNLAGPGANEAMREQIASHPGLLDNLKIGLDQDDNPRLRVYAATALIILRWTKDTSDLMQILSESLEIQDADLQEATASCLASLGRVSDSIRYQILKFPRMLETLINCLENDVNYDVRIEAASALINLASSSDPSIHTKMLSFPSLLRSLASSLRKRLTYELEENAVLAIANLAVSGANQAMREQIASHPGLLDNLEMVLDLVSLLEE